MEPIALLIAVTSLLLAAVAYWRSGGQRDVQRFEAQLRGELETLRKSQAELIDHAAKALAGAYDRTRERLRSARIRLRNLQESAVEGLDVQVRRAAEHLEVLAQRIEQSAASAKEATLSVARDAERALAVKARRLHARVVMLEVKGKATLARRAAAAHEFDRADARLAEAADLLHDARAILGDDDAYEEHLDAIKRALRDAVTAVRDRVEDARLEIDQVLGHTDRMVGALEADERDASHEEPAALGRSDSPSVQRSESRAQPL